MVQSIVALLLTLSAISLAISFKVSSPNTFTALSFVSINYKATQKSEHEKNSCCCEELKPECPEFTSIVDTKDILIDFKSKQIANKKDWYGIKKGEFIRLKIMNYNPYLYKVVIDSKDSSVAAPIDVNFLGGFISSANIATLAANIIGSAGKSPGVPNIADVVKVSPRMPLLVDRKTIMEILELEHLESKQNLTKADSLKIVDSIMIRVNDAVEEKEKQISRLKSRTDSTQYVLLRKFSVLRKLYPDCQTFKNLMTEDEMKKLEKTMQAFTDSIENISKEASDQIKLYHVLVAPYKKIIADNPKLQARDSLIKQFYKEVISNMAKEEDASNYKSLADIISKFETIMLYSNCYISFPLFVGDDVKKIDLQFKPRFDTLGLPVYNTSLVLPLLQKRVWGVSGGVFLTGLHNDGFNNKTVIRGTDTLYNLVEDNTCKSQFGINVLAYTGWKSKKINNANPNYWGLSFGGGISIESKPKPRIMLGGSFITGEKNRLIISLGIVSGYVSRLSNAFSLNTDYVEPATNFLKDVMKLNGFLSINYSFLSK